MTDAPDDERPEDFNSQGRWVPPPFRMPRMSSADQELMRRRQRTGARIMGLLLAALVLLIFLITVAKQAR